MTRIRGDVSVFGRFSDCPSDVVALFSEAECRNIQFGVAWFDLLSSTVLQVHGDVRIYVLRKASLPIAALPVLVRSGKRGTSGVESLSAFYTSLFAPALTSEASGHDMSVLIAAIATAHPSAGTFRFAPMDPGSTAYQKLEKGLSLAGMKPFRFFCFGNWYLSVDGDWPTYLDARQGAVRTTLRRMGKKFSRAQGTLEIITGPDRLEEGIRAYEHVYGASWKNDEPYADFMPGLIRLCAARGWLRLAVAWLDGKPIAAQIWIVANRRAEIYKLAYDDDFKAYSPGTLLTALLMQRAFEEEDVIEVDYLIGDDPYKEAWMSDRRERWGVIAYNPKTLSGRVGCWQERLGRAVKPLRAAFNARTEQRLSR